MTVKLLFFLTEFTFQPQRFLVSESTSHIMHNISFENIKVSKLATEVHTSNLSDKSCISLYAPVTIDTAAFGPQEDRLFSFGAGKKLGLRRETLPSL